jgi:hypothetical protein
VMPLEEARGATALFGPDIIKSLGALPAGELENRQKQYQDVQKTLDLTQKQQQAYDEMIRHIEAAGAEIETVFVKDLAKVAPLIEKFADKMTDAAKALPDFVADVQKSVDWMNQQETADNSLITTINSLNTGAQELGKTLREWVKKLLGIKGEEPTIDFNSNAGRGTLFGPLFPKGSQNDPLYVKPVEPLPIPESLTGIDGGIPGGVGAYSPSFAAPSGPRHSFGPGGTPLPQSLKGNPYTYPASSGTGALTQLITKEANEMAKKYNVDATWLNDTMEGIRAGESGHGSKYDIKDDALESSWGPFQLNRRRGLGVQFEKDTGLDVRDPKTIPEQAAWVAKYIATGHGTKDWMGFHGRRKADPRWGDAGYIAEAKKLIADAAPHRPMSPEEAADAARAANAVKKASGWEGAVGTPNAGVRIYDPTTGQQIYPSPTEQGPGGKQSMNDMRLYQMEKGLFVHVNNPAGATVTMQSAMLGAVKGSFA